MTKSSLISSLSNPVPKPKPPPPVSALERFVHYLHPLLQSHPGSVAPSITLPQLRVIAQTNFHQLIALSLSVHFNPRRPYEGHTGKEEKLIICKNGWNALRNFISAEREKVWRAEMTGLSVREQRVYKKRRKEEKKVANAAIREGRMAKFIDIANEYAINYAAFVKLGDEHSGRLRFRQIKKEQKDAAANALINSSALISASNVNAAISSVLPSPRPTPASYTLAHVVDEIIVKVSTDDSAHFASSSSSSPSSPPPSAAMQSMSSMGAMSIPTAAAAATSYFNLSSLSHSSHWQEAETKPEAATSDQQQPTVGEGGKDSLQQSPLDVSAVKRLWDFAEVNGDGREEVIDSPVSKRMRVEAPAAELKSGNGMDWAAAMSGHGDLLLAHSNGHSSAGNGDAPLSSTSSYFP